MNFEPRTIQTTDISRVDGKQHDSLIIIKETFTQALLKSHLALVEKNVNFRD